jgi:hypothetical protein
MAELLFSAETFRPDGSSVLGVPMLLDAKMRLIEPACAWLMHVALVRGGRAAPRPGAPTAKRSMTGGRRLRRMTGAGTVGSGEIAAYRDNMLHPPDDDEPLARSTINGRLRTIARFYHWCAGTGLIDRTPFTASDVALSRSRPPGFFAHIDASGGRERVNELTVRHVTMLPRPLAPSAIRRIIAEMPVRTGRCRMGGHDRDKAHGDRRVETPPSSEGLRRTDDAGANRRNKGRKSPRHLSAAHASGSDVGLCAGGARRHG